MLKGFLDEYNKCFIEDVIDVVYSSEGCWNSTFFSTRLCEKFCNLFLNEF